MKRIKVECEPGEVIDIGGMKFVVLDVENGHDDCADTLFILALSGVGQSRFGLCNNYAESELRDAVGVWLERMELCCIKPSLLVKREIDLTTLDGYKDYGKLTVAAAPLTLDEARKYSEIIPNANQMCWLATGWSGLDNSDCEGVLGVESNGLWKQSSCLHIGGIRPALKVSADIFADTPREKSLQDISTEDLLNEIHRRIECREEVRE